MKATYLLLAAMAASALVGLSACAPHTAGVAVNSAGDVRVDNAGLARQVAVEHAGSRLQAGLLQGSAVVASKVGTDLHLQYKFTWFDAGGYSLEGEAGSWKPLKLHGKQQLQVNALAPNANAVAFEVYVREAISN
ncbi:YcfL family protein [Shewanella sp. AS16]|uniref:YcfL family protein n=1 Tax=Shewanella sp. AS16 TaxID=2907625 RepID=UPI001F202D31|nr:YcfL family protein [Shewanella sp. AS16]MCE9684826.1 YcfL family protein [Shewanella sp. AS16]